MKNQNSLPSNPTDILEDKPFWAAFFNLARHNVYLTVNHINKLLDLKKLYDEDKHEEIFEREDILNISDDVMNDVNSNGKKRKLDIKKIWDDLDTDLTRKYLLRELILKHFPFIQPAIIGAQTKERTTIDKDKRSTSTSNDSLKQTGEGDINDPLSLSNVKSMFFCLLQMLEQLRNYYSHVKHSKSATMPNFDEDLLNWMRYIFIDSVNKVKEDYSSNSVIDPNTCFSHLIYKDKQGKIKPCRYPFTSKDGSINAFGLLFFVSLFLEKQDSIWMQKKIPGFKKASENYMKMTNEVFCRNHILLPKMRLETVYDKDWMLLDMLNEVVRCPLSLYKRLAPADQNKFKVPEKSSDNANRQEDDNPFSRILVRHQNRFPYFALRFFDLNEVFTTLRFQINLGCYHFAICKKQIGDKKEVHHLTRTLYGFSRLQNFTQNTRPEEWNTLVKTTELSSGNDGKTVQGVPLPYISYTIPHYQIENEKIGIKIFDGDTAVDTDIWPSVSTEKQLNKPDKYTLTPGFKADVFLSVHELLPMMFYYQLLLCEGMLKTDAGNAVEKVLIDTRNAIFNLYDAFVQEKINTITDLENYLQDKPILIGHLPKQMIDLLKGHQRDMLKAVEQKKAMLIKDTERRLERLNKQPEQKPNVAAKNTGTLLRNGQIADWLVNDMMRFQPVKRDKEGNPINCSKANSTEYQMLQRAFAFYTTDSYRLPRYFEQLHLINCDNSHLFLSRFEYDKQPNLIAFYAAYLEAKLEFLNELQPQNWASDNYFLLLRAPKNDRQKLAEGWKNGFNLPRGLFTEKIKTWFNEHKTIVDISDCDIFKNRVGQVARLIPVFFNKKFKDHSQPFYTYNFNVGNVSKPTEANYLSKEKRENLFKSYQNKFKNNIPAEKTKEYREYKNFSLWKKFERELRLIKNQDILIWLMCKNLFDEKIKPKKDILEPRIAVSYIKLDSLQTNTSTAGSLNALAKVVPMTLAIHIDSPKPKGKARNNGKENKEFTVYIKEEGTKLLKWGNFKTLLADRRIKGLFSYIEHDDINLEKYPLTKYQVDSELDLYQKYRIDIFKQTLDLEAQLLDKYSDLNTDNFNQMLSGWSEKEGIPRDIKEDTDFLKDVRNAFSHNQYPDSKKIVFSRIRKFNPKKLILEEKKGLGIAKQMYEEVEKVVNRIKGIELFD